MFLSVSQYTEYKLMLETAGLRDLYKETQANVKRALKR